ncbi:MAG: hypothetical protein ACJ76H_07590 [Bacteriovoracaceae bacterium]
MRLFKIILVIFGIYFIRRFWQLYQVMEKRGREISADEAARSEKKQEDDKKTVEADYKVID